MERSRCQCPTGARFCLVRWFGLSTRFRDEFCRWLLVDECHWAHPNALGRRHFDFKVSQAIWESADHKGFLDRLVLYSADCGIGEAEDPRAAPTERFQTLIPDCASRKSRIEWIVPEENSNR